jgi:transposase, IS30 family
MRKVRTFGQLTEGERSKIEVLLHQGWSLTRIAKALGRHVCTISREVKRNGPVVYRATRAQYFTSLRHRQKRKRKIFDDAMKGFIQQQLVSRKWSPEFISAKGRQWRKDFISAEWIYQWIWRMKFSQARKDKVYTHLYEYLKHARRRRKRGRKHNMRGNILFRRWIDERPKPANQRKRQGDLEADIILGKDRQPGLLVALDRSSRKTWLRKLETKDTYYVMEKLVRICAEIGNVKTVTLDNDQSFAEHFRLNATGIQTFFTHPYSSQEKGSVENRIGIIRMFFPKKTDFRTVSEQQIVRIQNLLNERPLRMFNYKSPNEIHIS